MAKRRPAGDGMVRKREDGRWEGRIVVGHKSNGDSIFRYISAPTQKELSAKLRQLTEAYKGVDLTEESNMFCASNSRSSFFRPEASISRRSSAWARSIWVSNSG